VLPSAPSTARERLTALEEEAVREEMNDSDPTPAVTSLFDAESYLIYILFYYLISVNASVYRTRYYRVMYLQQFLYHAFVKAFSFSVNSLSVLEETTHRVCGGVKINSSLRAIQPCSDLNRLFCDFLAILPEFWCT